jgi:PAS domain S-box-containing protein
LKNSKHKEKNTGYVFLSILTVLSAIILIGSYLAYKNYEQYNALVTERLWLMVLLIGMLIVSLGIIVGLMWRNQRNRFHAEQYRLSAALKDSETRYRRLFETAQDGILILNAKTGMIIDVNPFLIKMLGFSHDQFLEKTIWEVGFLKDIVPNKDKFLELQQKEYVRYENLPLETSDGKKIDVEFVSNVYLVDHQKIIQCNIRNITERKRAEEAERYGRKELDRLFEVSPEMIGIIGFDGRFKRMNPAWEKALGYPIDTMLSKQFIEYVHPEDIEATNAEAAKLAIGERTIQFENRYRCTDGSYRWLSWSVIPVIEEKLLYGVARDITEHKRAEKKLIASETRYRRLFETAQDGILILDAESGKIIDVNKFLIDMLNYSHEEFVGKELWEIGTFKNIAASKDAFIELQQQQYIRFENMPLETKDGRHINVEFVSNIYLVDQKTIVQCNIRDITERKIIEDKLALLMENLKRSNTDLEQFAYVASHDLQEPLRMVSSFVQLLAERYKGKLNADADDFIRFAVDGANRMQQLISDLLAYSRIGKNNEKSIQTNCESVLEIAETNLKEVIQESDAVITHDPLPTVVIEKTQLLQVFQNLLGNSIKFRSKESPRLHISAAHHNSEWTFSFQDNGIGIDPQFKDRIFVIFQRLHSKEEYPGTGIGLAICKKIVERNGGQIWVTSEQGKGSIFYFTLPVLDTKSIKKILSI